MQKDIQKCRQANRLTSLRRLRVPLLMGVMELSCCAPMLAMRRVTARIHSAI
jgi:hypothetical protein